MLGFAHRGQIPRGIITFTTPSLSTRLIFKRNTSNSSNDITNSWIYSQHTNSTCSPSKVNSPETLSLLQTVDSEATNLETKKSTFSNLLAKGKQFVKLYKSGITNVYKNYNTCRHLKSKYNFKNLNELTNYIVASGFAQGIEKKNKVNESPSLLVTSDNHITRAEYIKLLRTSKDIRKLPIFAIFFAIFFEMTPILLMIFPRIAPSTCMSPSLVSKDVTRINNKITSLKSMNHDTQDNHQSQYSRSVYKLSKEELTTLSSVLLYPTSFLPLEKFHTIKSLQAKLKTRIDEIRSDDILLSRFGSTRSLDDQELLLACQSRAISTTNKTNDQLRTELLQWMSEFSHNNYDAGFFFS